MAALRIGLLLDSLMVPLWQEEIVHRIIQNPSIELQLVVVGNSTKSSSGRIVYKVFRRLDRHLFSFNKDCFSRTSLSGYLIHVQVIKIKPEQTRYTDEFSEEDVRSIEQCDIDVLIRFGFRILKGKILHAARYGVWSLHHGDNAVNRGGPPAFWEVVNKEPVTGVTLQVLSENLDDGKVIDKAYIRTNLTSFNRNQNALYWAGVELFCSALLKLANEVKSSSKARLPQPLSNAGLKFYSYPLYRSPGNLKATRIFTSFWLRRLNEGIASIFKKPQWALWYKFNIGLKEGLIETSLYRYKKLTPPRGTDWADPFVIKKGDEYFVLFEEKPAGSSQAHISYLSFDAKGMRQTERPIIALKEPYHLSYPFLFTHEGEYFMIPEATASNSVWLYKAENFPTQWKRHRELLSDTALYDPTLAFYENRWYLFGTQKPFAGNSADQYLYIYYTDDLLKDNWQPHAMNPVTRDVRTARPAGRFFLENGKLIRPVQLGAPNYGYGISFFEIVELTPTEFEQRHIQDILPHWRSGLRAAHTFNYEGGFGVVDAQG